MDSVEIGDDDYFWCEGMSEWRLVADFYKWEDEQEDAKAASSAFEHFSGTFDDEWLRLVGEGFVRQKLSKKNREVIFARAKEAGEDCWDLDAFISSEFPELLTVSAPR